MYNRYMQQYGFDNEKYLQEQTASIRERTEHFGNKLYLECGGKLLYDYHATRVLPGFDPNVKMRVFQSFKEDLEVIICIYAGDIERKKIRSDFGLAYDSDVLKMLDDFAEWEIPVCGVVITRFEQQPAAVMFKNKLKRRGIKVYTHGYTKGYPTDVDLIVSDKGYGANSYIETTKPIVVVTAPGPGSGKLATCLSQLYHDYKRGNPAGYAKFETFPIWNLPLKHPVNVAYEAATADLADVNQLDHFHIDAYGDMAVNYNRDLEAFPVLKRILERITGESSLYKSPTDMGVNRCGFGIVNNAIVEQAARREIIRRYYRSACEYRLGMGTKDAVERIDLLMKQFVITLDERPVIEASHKKLKKDRGPIQVRNSAAVELKDGTIITARNTDTLHAVAGLMLHALKYLADIPKSVDLLPKEVIEPMVHLKKTVLKERRWSLDLDETLTALAISAATQEDAAKALEQLPNLRGCDSHVTHIPTPGDESGVRKIGIHLTSDPEFSTKLMFPR